MITAKNRLASLTSDLAGIRDGIARSVAADRENGHQVAIDVLAWSRADLEAAR